MTVLEENQSLLSHEALNQQVSLPEVLTDRVDEAIQTCEIEPTAEVKAALAGYYADHYELATFIDGVLTGDIADEQLTEVLEREHSAIQSSLLPRALEAYDYQAFPIMPSAESATRMLAYALQQERQGNEDDKPHLHDLTLRAASSALSFVLFQEESLGITTLSQQEQQMIEGLYAKLLQVVNGTTARIENGQLRWPINKTHHLTRNIPNLKSIIESIQTKQQEFWGDCRQAGQLEFHNTGFLAAINRSGAIMPRTEQHRRTGKMHAQTEVWERMHSVMPHFSEQFDPRGYKIGPKGVDAHIIDPDYGPGTVAIPLAEIIEIAPFARDAHYGIVKPKDEAVLTKVPVPTFGGLASLSYGHDDVAGSGGTDRVFFASPSETPNKMPDEYDLPIGRHMTYIFTGDEEIGKSEQYGLGESLPGRLHIAQGQEILDKITMLQHEYLQDPSYAGWLVVPLRRGIFTFRGENMDIRRAGSRPEPTYNAKPTA